MKKIGLIAALLALCVMMSGCITINVQPRQQAQPAVDEAADLPTTDGSELDFEIEDLFSDEEADDWDVERTITPATDADQIEGVRVDYVIRDDAFVDQCIEIAYYPEEYLGKNISLTGYALHYDEQDGQTQFAVVREYEDHDEEDYIDSETGEVIEHDHGESLAGFDCQYAGELPAENAWVRIVGTLEEYVFTDTDSGESFDAMMLKVLHIEPTTAPQ